MKLTDFSLHRLAGDVLEPSTLEGRVVLLVNVASQCGLTPQYRGLEALQGEFGDRGFMVIGLPCNQFAGQEPGDATEIQHFCDVNYHITFPLTAKLEVNGPGRAPLYAWLAGEKAAFPGDITWNFEKFLVGRDGEVKARFGPRTPPEDMAIKNSIENLL